MPTTVKHSSRLWSGVRALMLLALTVSIAASVPTWADRSDGAPPSQTAPVTIEPFSFQLSRPPTGAPVGAAGAALRPAASGDWSDLMNAGFEDTFLPDGWQVQGENVWTQSSTRAHSGSRSAAVENFDGAPATWLIYGGADGFSLANLADARLNFAYWLDTANEVYLGWAASADGVTFHGARTAGQVNAWLAGSLDLRHLLGDESVWIAFTLSGSGSGSNQNVFLDDVAIAGQEPYVAYLPLGMKNHAPPSIDFHDDFSDPKSGWPVEHFVDPPTYEVHRDYANGSYWMKLNYIWFHRIFASPVGVRASGEYTLQTDLMYDYGDYRAEWGLIFEASDDMEFYYMLALYRYGPDLLYRIRRRTPGEGEVNLADAAAPWFLERISWKWGSIRIVRQGDQLSFYGYNPHPASLRWELVKTVTAPPLSSDRVGLTVFSSELGAEAYFDNFHLWQRAIEP